MAIDKKTPAAKLYAERMGEVVEAARQIVEYSRPDRGVDASEYENEVLVPEENWLALRQALASLDAPTDSGTAEVGPDAEGGTAEMRWIPVSERLPEVYEIVLVYSPIGGVEEAQMGGPDHFVLTRTDGYNMPIDVIPTHWQYLPAPPTANAKEDE